MSITGKWFGFGKNERYDEGLRSYDRGEFEDAIEAFQVVLEKKPDPATNRLARFYLVESFRRLAERQMREERYVDALANLASAIELQPAYPDLHLAKAKAHGALEQWPEETLEVDTALSLHPGYAEANFYKGYVMFREGCHAEGMERVTEAVRMDPQLGTEQYEAAVRAFGSGMASQAMQCLGSAARSEDADANALLRRAEQQLRNRDLDSAIREFESALRIAPRYADLRCKYGMALLELDRVADALVQFETALDINPKYAEAHAQRGIAMKRLKNPEAARAAFQSALALNPDHPIAQLELGRRP